jgi:NifU-like protein involved in Fe-S cluster formation
MALDKLYQQVILDHNRSPHHYGRLEGATHSARGGDPIPKRL